MSSRFSSTRWLLILAASLGLQFSSNFCGAQVNAGKDVDLKVLANSKEWLRLLRYERAFFELGRNSSAVKDRVFFLSERGHLDPHSELLVTFQRFHDSWDSVVRSDDHAICRFPARYKWLSRHVKELTGSENFARCTAYNKWRASGQIDSISIYFATGYFGNPASFFGHPLLKFNVAGSESQLVDSSLNYGAVTPENENPVLYVLKGLFGGYSASFTRHDFFYHNHNYSETEMRDLWEYRLNLDPPEVEYIVDHTWELLGRNHPYFFLLDNCAFRMAELLEHVFDQQLIFRNFLYVIPIDLYTSIASGRRHDGRPMVQSVTRIPSRYSRLVEAYESQPATHRDIIKSMIDSPSLLQSESFSTLPDLQKTQIIDTLMHYYAFRKLKEPESKDFDGPRIELIRERFKVSSPTPPSIAKEVLHTPPNMAQHSFNVQLASIYGENTSWFQEIHLRPALYDELNPAVARPNNSSLVVFDTTFRIRAGQLSLRGLDVFRVSSLGASRTDLPGDRNLSWKMQMGVKSLNQSCTDCLVGALSGGVGGAQNIFNIFDLYALIKAQIQNNRNDMGTLAGGPELGVYIEIVPWWKVHGSYEMEAFINGLKTRTDFWTVENRFGESQSWDLRVGYFQRDDRQLRLSWNWYL